MSKFATTAAFIALVAILSSQGTPVEAAGLAGNRSLQHIMQQIDNNNDSLQQRGELVPITRAVSLEDNSLQQRGELVPITRAVSLEDNSLQQRGELVPITRAVSLSEDEEQARWRTPVLLRGLDPPQTPDLPPTPLFNKQGDNDLQGIQRAKIVARRVPSGFPPPPPVPPPTDPLFSEIGADVKTPIITRSAPIEPIVTAPFFGEEDDDEQIWVRTGQDIAVVPPKRTTNQNALFG